MPGYTCEAHNNPADFFLDVINGDSSAIALSSKNESGAFQKSSHCQNFYVSKEYYS